MNSVRLESYMITVNKLFSIVGQAVGIHVSMLVIEHSIWLTRQKYEEASLIVFSEEGISLENLGSIEPVLASTVAYEFITAIRATLGRLIGKQLARQLTEQLQLDQINPTPLCPADSVTAGGVCEIHSH